MIQTSSSSDYRRRILTFPVIHPCQSSTPTTLLTSLIHLSHKIFDYKSKNFVSQSKHGREMIRFIWNLLIFFEEIRGNGSVLPHSINLCLFELHLTFQKILFLLEDCTREGSRLWILMKFKRVSTEFRVLVRTISTSIDVLPWNSVQISCEGREILQFVLNQAEKGKFGVDSDNEKLVMVVISILNQFEKREIPDPVNLKLVLDYLGIQSWHQCNKEIKFLEEETGFGISNGEDKEVVFLRNLMAFMIYSRVVIFDYIDNDTRSNLIREINHEKMISFLNPEDFLCPISLEIMIDPVTISTGQTFDRISIQKWFKSGNLICPKTGEKLTSTELVPNSVMKKLIRLYCSCNGISVAAEQLEPVQKGNRNDIKRTRVELTKQTGVAEEAMKMVIEFLTSNLSTGISSVKNKSAYEIRLLGKSNIFNLSPLFEESGSIPYLLNLLSSLSSSIQENAMGALLNLIKNQKQSKIKRLIVENGGLILILDILTEGLKIETRQIAATTLFHLSSIEEYRKLIGEIPEAIPALVDLIRRDNSSIGKKSGVIAILGLLWFPGNYKKVIEAGTVKLLIDLLSSSSSSSSSDFITDSLAVLAILAEKPEGSFTILRTKSALYKLVGILESSSISGPGKEYCVSILHSLCTNGGSEVVSVLRRPASLITSLYNLLTEGTSRASKNASSILKILHEFSDPSSSSSSSTRSLALELRFVHVQ